MTPEQIVAILAALAGVLGAWLEHRRHSRDRELAALSERVRAVEVRCELLERRD